MPKIDKAPRIKKRTQGGFAEVIELTASSDYLDSIEEAIDASDHLFEGWCIREAFLAGIDYQRSQNV